MKQCCFSLGILIILTGFCWYTTHRVEVVCSEASDLLEQAETRILLGDYDGAEGCIATAKQTWEDHRLLLGMALRHTESDEVDLNFPGLLAACRQKDRQEFQLRNRTLIASLRQLSAMEKPYSYNIL